MAHYIPIEDCKASGQHLQSVDADGYCGGCGEQPEDNTEDGYAHGADAVPTASADYTREKAEELLKAARTSQAQFWRDLSELEQFLGFEVNSDQDLQDTDLNAILANPGAPVTDAQPNVEPCEDDGYQENEPYTKTEDFDDLDKAFL